MYDRKATVRQYFLSVLENVGNKDVQITSGDVRPHGERGKAYVYFSFLYRSVHLVFLFPPPPSTTVLLQLLLASFAESSASVLAKIPLCL